MTNDKLTGEYPYLADWKLLKGDRILGKDYLHSEIYAELDGRWVKVAGVCLVLTPSDHKRMPEPWDFERTKERDAIYTNRKSEPYCDAHLGLALSAVYSYELLMRYKETGRVDTSALHRVLGIAEGKVVPIIGEQDDCHPRRVPRLLGRVLRHEQSVSPLLDWVLSRYDEQDGTHYGDIYARIDGEFATVVRILSCIAREDYDRLVQLDKEHGREVREYFDRYRATLLDKALHRKQVDEGETVWHNLMSKQRVEHDAIYEPGKQYIEGHRHLLVSAPYSYIALCDYRDTGRMDEQKLRVALEIARGDTVPSVYDI